MTWKLALLVLASAAMLASTPASARFHRHSHYHFGHYHFFHGGQRYLFESVRAGRRHAQSLGSMEPLM
jgi:hypothetical protein